MHAVHSLAAGKARRLTFRVAATASLVASLVPSCAPRDVHVLAVRDDAHYRTGAFTWLVDHEPSAVVAWRVDPATLRALLPESAVTTAGAAHVCAQTKQAHAALFVVADRSATTIRDYALDCGVSLYRDAGAIVVAPR